MEDDIIIDNYLKGLLSKDEEKLVLKRLDNDAEFYEKFQIEKYLFESINEDNWSFLETKNEEFEVYKKLLEQEQFQQLRKTLDHTNSEFKNEKGIRTRRLYYYLAAASIVVFLGFQFFFNQNVSNQDLYNNYIDLDNLPSFVSRSDQVNLLNKGQELFENKNYEEALVVFESINEKQTKDLSSLLIYKGVAQIEMSKYTAAEDTFNRLIDGDLIDSQKGYWYKALLFLKQDRVKEAEKILENIVSNSLFNDEKAQQLLSNL